MTTHSQAISDEKSYSDSIHSYNLTESRPGYHIYIGNHFQMRKTRMAHDRSMMNLWMEAMTRALFTVIGNRKIFYVQNYD